MLGRFAQPDSIVPGGVQGSDRYAYVSNNPIKLIDPSGHKCVGDAGECDIWEEPLPSGPDDLNELLLDPEPRNNKTNVSGLDYYEWYQYLWKSKDWWWWETHDAFSICDFMSLILYAELDNVGDPSHPMSAGYELYREGLVRAAYGWCGYIGCDASTAEGALNWLAAYSQSGAGRYRSGGSFDEPTHSMGSAALLANSIHNPGQFGSADWANGFRKDRPFGVGNRSLYLPKLLYKALNRDGIAWRSGQNTGNEVIVPTGCGILLLYGQFEMYRDIACGK